MPRGPSDSDCPCIWPPWSPHPHIPLTCPITLMYLFDSDHPRLRPPTGVLHHPHPRPLPASSTAAHILIRHALVRLRVSICPTTTQYMRMASGELAYCRSVWGSARGSGLAAPGSMGASGMCEGTWRPSLSTTSGGRAPWNGLGEFLSATDLARHELSRSTTTKLLAYGRDWTVCIDISHRTCGILITCGTYSI